ncbi:MAG: PorT family protein [Bacteroidia bacterium]|nr:PorT family protein [Bacteroidia bacterium]
MHLYLLLIFSTSLLLAQPSSKRWQVGLQSGFNIPAYRSSKKIDKAITLLGFTGGIDLKFNLTSNWSVRSGLYFSQRNSAYLVKDKHKSDTVIGPIRDEYVVHILNDGKLSLAHVELPVLFQWDLRHSSYFAAYFLTGAHLGYRVFAQNRGTTQVSLEGLDFLPLFGFSPQTRLIVAEGSINNETIEFRNLDTGIWIGGGNAYKMGKGWMNFEVRSFLGVVNILKNPPSDRLYNGSVMFLTGYSF